MGSFNVRGLTKDIMKEQLVRDVNQYDVDVCALQETKIENPRVHRVNGSVIITSDSKRKLYGNGFIDQRSGRNRSINTRKNQTESVFCNYPGILIPVLMERSTIANQQGNVESRLINLR